MTNKRNIRPDIDTIKDWKKHPWFALQEYCTKYNISLEFKNNFLDDTYEIIVGKKNYWMYSTTEEGLPITEREARNNLAAYYYEQELKPHSKEEIEEKRKATKLDDWKDIIHILDGINWEKNYDWTETLRLMCHRAKLAPTADRASIIEEGQSVNFKKLPSYQTIVRPQNDVRVYIDIPGIDGNVFANGDTYKSAKNNAAKQGLRYLWLAIRIKETKDDMKDGADGLELLAMYQKEKSSIERTSIRKYDKNKDKSEKSLDITPEQLAQLKAKFNRPK